MGWERFMDAEAYYVRGNAYAAKGEYDFAISDFNKAIESNPELAMAHYGKGFACERAGRIKEAISAYKAFIQYATPQLASYIEVARKKVRVLERRIRVLER